MSAPVTATTNHDGAIWGRLIGPENASFSPAVARLIIALEFPAEDKARMHELAAKARQGALTPQEREEVESYSRVGSVLGIMKSKARVSPKRAKVNGKRR